MPYPEYKETGLPWLGEVPAHSKKHDVFVLDFMNNSETIMHAFSDYYRTTILSEETDPNKLHDLKAVLDGCQVMVKEADQWAFHRKNHRRTAKKCLIL